MKEYIRQIYEEGLGYVVFQPIKKYIDKNTKGEKKLVLNNILKVVYLIIALILTIVLFYVKFPSF